MGTRPWTWASWRDCWVFPKLFDKGLVYKGFKSGIFVNWLIKLVNYYYYRFVFKLLLVKARIIRQVFVFWVFYFCLFIFCCSMPFSYWGDVCHHDIHLCGFQVFLVSCLVMAPFIPILLRFNIKIFTKFPTDQRKAFMIAGFLKKKGKYGWLSLGWFPY